MGLVAEIIFFLATAMHKVILYICCMFDTSRWFSLIDTFLFSSANPLPAGIITADGQQQNVMVYTTSYQQVIRHGSSKNDQDQVLWFCSDLD